MTIETTLVATVAPLLTGGFFPDVAPLNTATPYGTYSQVGGDAVNYVEGGLPGKYFARIQINVWGKTRAEANTAMKAVENAVRPAPLNATVLGALISRYNELNGNRGAQQDFRFFSA